MKKRMLLAAALIGGTMFVTAPSFAKNEKIAVIIKATDSDFWQYLVVGAKNYAHDHPGVSMTVYGPPSETDIEQQVSILENVVTRHPSGILIAASSSDAPADAIAQDRIAVMHKGRIMGIVDKGEATEELLLRLASRLPA